jgi:hypothetical protein
MARVLGGLPDHDPPAELEREATLPDGGDLVEIRKHPELRLHPRALQGAAPGLAVERLRGDEMVLLENLHLKEPSLRFHLPREAPVFRVVPAGLKAFSPDPVLQTVRIDPEKDRVSLTWCGAIRLAVEVPVEFLRQTELTVTWRKI